MDDVWAEALRGADPGNAELLVTHFVDVTVSVVPATTDASDWNSGKFPDFVFVRLVRLNKIISFLNLLML